MLFLIAWRKSIKFQRIAKENLQDHKKHDILFLVHERISLLFLIPHPMLTQLEIKKSRFQVNDKFILSVGEFRRRTSAARPLATEEAAQEAKEREEGKGGVEEGHRVRSVAQLAGEVWMSHGALAYWETVQDDPTGEDMRSFRLCADAKDNEVVIFAWVVYATREDRDRILAAVMVDPRLSCNTDLPFDMKRMAHA